MTTFAEIVGKAGVFSIKKALPEINKLYPSDLSLSQNSVSFGKGFRKSGLKPTFSVKSKVAFPKTEVLGKPHFIIANADGATGGNGLGYNHAAYLHKLGINVLTTGECCYYKKDLAENFEKLNYVLRPENLNPQSPGLGARIYKAGNEKIAVVNLLGQSCFSRIHSNSPFALLPALLERLIRETQYIIIDFHAQSSAEKKTLFYAADGLCSAVIGSHTRVQTADEQILSGGTGVISDAGRTGSAESVGGCEIQSRIQEYISGIPDWTRDAWEKLELQGVYLDIGEDGKAIGIKRINFSVNSEQWLEYR